MEWVEWYNTKNDYTGLVTYYGVPMLYSLNGKPATEKEVHDIKYTSKLEDLLNE